MVIKRILHILLVLGVLGALFYFVTAGYTRPAVKTKEYHDPNFSQLYGVPDKTELTKEIYSVAGKGLVLKPYINGTMVTVTGNITNHNPDQPYTHEKMHKLVIYMPISIFRKFADVQRVRCVINNKNRNYGVDVTRDAFESFVGISPDNPTNNWESNVVSMLVYDKINRDNFMELYGLYKPEY